MAKCISPIELEDGRKVNCHKCKACFASRRQAWVLACMAELETSDGGWTVTLTYRDGEAGSERLIYRDVQKMFKRLRKAGHRFRYLSAGEHGGQKGRPHWHIIFFFSGSDRPDLGQVISKKEEKYQRRLVPWWPHGHVVIDEDASHRHFSYVVKYITKEHNFEGKFTCSKRPGIGQTYFDLHAAKAARAGAPKPFNNFTVGGYTAGLSARRWLRYREITVEMLNLLEKGHPPFDTYENILSRADRRELEEYRDAQYMREKMLPRPSDVRYHESSDDAVVISYQQHGAYWLRIDLKGGSGLNWLHGFFHSRAGFRAASARPAEGAPASVTVLIDRLQRADLCSGLIPTPAENPLSLSDWITKAAAQERFRDKQPSNSVLYRNMSATCYVRQPSGRWFLGQEHAGPP